MMIRMTMMMKSMMITLMTISYMPILFSTEVKKDPAAKSKSKRAFGRQYWLSILLKKTPSMTTMMMMFKFAPEASPDKVRMQI